MCNFYATFVIKQNYKNNCFEKYFNIEKIRQFTQKWEFCLHLTHVVPNLYYFKSP